VTLVEEPRRRLHPLTPLLRSGRLAALVIAGLSWQGYKNLGTEGWLLAVGAVSTAVLLGSVVSWYVTGYHVVGRELRVHEGLLSRRTRAIPLERLQSVELVQPLLARLFGLAELRLEVVGAAKTEAPLAFLPVGDATALRERLLTLARIGPPSPEPVTSEELTIHQVRNRDVVISQLLRPHWWFLPLAIAAPIFVFSTGADVGFIAVASMVTAVLGAVQVPVRTLLREWQFTVATASDGLHLHRGLTETRSQTVPAGRIQTLDVQWPLLWRPLGWVRVQMHIAGVSLGRDREARAGLLPVGTVPVAETVIATALPDFVLRSVAVQPVPGRAGVLAPLRQFVLGYQLTPTAFVVRDGLLTRQLVVVPYGRIQSVRIRQGPLQRLLRLASVWADTAGGGAEAVALHRDVREATALATELAERSRAARRGDLPPS
jgi:putative membrane protein